MVDYSLYTNEDEVPGEGLVLKKARRSIGGTLSSGVTTGRSVLPNARASVDPSQRAADLYKQGEEMYQQYLNQNEGAGDAAMLNALAAQYAGDAFAPLQQQFLKKATTSEDTRAKKAEFLMQQAKAYETLAQQAETARERIAAQRQAQELQNQLRLMGLQIQQQGLDLRRENAALARGQQEQAAADRRDRNLNEGTQKLSQRAQDLTGLYSSVRELNDALTGYASRGESIPGIGLGANTTIGGINVSSPFIGEKGRLNRSMAQNVLNQIIRADSGQSVSTQEAARQLLANMNSSQFTENDFLNAWENNILPRVNESFTNLGAGFSQEVKKRYRDQGGKIDFDKQFQKPRGESASSSGSSSKLSAQEQAELDALRKRFGGK